jgi:hypothetical protein
MYPAHMLSNKDLKKHVGIFYNPMKTKKKITISILLLTIATTINAQTDVDAVRYAGNSITGSARFTAMGGAFGALGGDFSTLSYNPAGIAIYRSSEFIFSPSVFASTTKSNFLGHSTDEQKYNFNIGNTGLIYTKKIGYDETTPGWKSWNFGLGYNRLNNFHTQSFYQGQNLSNSLLDNFAQNSYGTDYQNLDPFYEQLAYYDSLISPDINNQYYGLIPNGKEVQRRSAETEGAIGETVFSFGANYSNKFYLGATLGFKSLRYVQTSNYEEFDPDTSIPNLKSFNFQEDYYTRGSGFDFKFGMIYKATDNLRFGLAVKTPTWYSLHDDYKTSMVSYLDSGITSIYANESPDGAYDYDYTSPFRFIASTAFVFEKDGLICVDYEFTDISDARFNAGGSAFVDVNSLIRDKYKETHTVRLGTEWLYQQLSFRGGYSFTTTPFNNSFKAGSFDFSKNSFSAGIGIKENNLFFDLGYVYTKSLEYYQPYTLSDETVPGVKSEVISSNFVFTFGIKF